MMVAASKTNVAELILATSQAMSVPKLQCRLCGYGPIPSGVTVCQGCGATIGYVGHLVTLIYFIGWFCLNGILLAAIGIISIPLIGVTDGWPSLLMLLSSTVLATLLVRWVYVRHERRNEALGRATFIRWEG
jgi:hypothetical protein